MQALRLPTGMRFESSLVTNVQRINNKDAHRSNDSGAPRLGNDCTNGREMVRSVCVSFLGITEVYYAKRRFDSCHVH